jgi:Leucine-rich repeat (LRR) protein
VLLFNPSYPSLKRSRGDEADDEVALAVAEAAVASAANTTPQSLTLCDLHLDMIPESAYTLQSLVELWLCDNRLSEIPAQIGELKQLRHLWLGSNRLVAVPKTIKKNRQLRSLGLENNFISTLVRRVLFSLP